MKNELYEAWVKVYLSLNMANSKDPLLADKLAKMKDLLAETNEIVSEVFGEPEITENP